MSLDSINEWRTAFGAEVDSHKETRNVLASTRAQVAAVMRLNTDTERELAIVRRKLSAATKLLEANGLKLPEEPKLTEWYSCAICSTKTDAPASLAREHACCGAVARIGPCCHKATETSPEEVAAIVASSGHAHGCRGT